MLFPQFKDRVSGYVNLNIEARLWIAENNITRDNALIDPEVCQRMVNDVHKKYSVDYSYGGWFEDRSFLWKGSYLDTKDSYTHLAVDFNAPAQTEVAVDFAGEVMRVSDDHPLDGGWGPHVVIKHATESLYMLYAHLDREIFCKVGDVLTKGQVFAKVGQAPYNGNWFSHVHVQTIDSAFYEALIQKNDFDSLDGYGNVDDIRKNAQLFRDPMAFIEL